MKKNSFETDPKKTVLSTLSSTSKNNMYTISIMSLTVDEFADVIKNSLSEIHNVEVCGEIGRITKLASGHTFFDLVSCNAQISCVAWSSSKLDVSECM